MSLLNPCIKPRGKRDADLMLIGEAPGEVEEQLGAPFMGPSGQLLTMLLKESGIHPAECYYTNVLYTRPPGNSLDAFCISKRDLPQNYPLTALGSGAYLHPDFLPELDRLHNEIASVNPNLILALGGTAAWAVLGSPKISAVRGTVTRTNSNYKALATYHPAYLFKDWTKRVIVLADFIKAKAEKEFPEIRRPERRIKINPTFQEVTDFVPRALEAPVIATDTETSHGQITMVGFATSVSEAFVIPFWDSSKESKRYWSQDVEPWIWTLIKEILTRHPHVVMQNGLYDLQYFWRMGISVPGFRDDTMLMHHSLYPELPKGLGFLGSVHTNETAWKQLRLRGSHTNKRDE